MAGAYTVDVEFYGHTRFDGQGLAFGHGEVVTFDLNDRVLGPYTADGIALEHDLGRGLIGLRIGIACGFVVIAASGESSCCQTKGSQHEMFGVH